MARRASRPCADSSCPNKAVPGHRYCEHHAYLSHRPKDTRPSASRRGYDRKWRRIRSRFIEKHPFCSICGKPAQEVDHIVPLSKGGTHHWSNLQAMCKFHHSQKTAYWDGGLGKDWGGGDKSS